MGDENKWYFESQRRLPCVLCVDVSESMRGDSISIINQKLVELGKSFKADARARECVDISIIAFGTNAEVIMSMTPAISYQAPTLVAGGQKAMNAAINLGLDIIEDRLKFYRQCGGIAHYIPLLFVLSDGNPTDITRQAATIARLQKCIECRKVFYRPMSIGAAANDAVLKSYYPDRRSESNKRVLRVTQDIFEEGFEWDWDSVSIYEYVQDIMPENPGERHVACVLCVDVSGSMSGEPIKELNQGLVEFGNALKADAMACGRADVAIIAFGSEAEVIMEMSPANQYQAPILQAGGLTAMNGAIDLGLDIIEERKRIYRSIGTEYYRPWLFVLTDGYPTDTSDQDTVKVRLQDYIRNNKIVYMPMSIGTGVDKAILQAYYPDEFAANKKIILKATQNNFRDAFQWLSNSISKVSKSNPLITDQVRLPELPSGITIGI